MANPTLAECLDAAGSINNPSNVGGLVQPIVGPGSSIASYVAPELCLGQWSLTSNDECNYNEASLQESLAAENLHISGAPVNIFKLLGIHEQGKLIDLTGNGQPLGSGTPANAFDAIAGAWVSSEIGTGVLTTPAFIGYDFGIRLTSFGQPENGPDANFTQHIT